MFDDVRMYKTPISLEDRIARAIRNVIDAEHGAYDVIQSLHDEYNRELNESEIAHNLNTRAFKLTRIENEEVTEENTLNGMFFVHEFMLRFIFSDENVSNRRVSFEINEHNEVTIRYTDI